MIQMMYQMEKLIKRKAVIFIKRKVISIIIIIVIIILLILNLFAVSNQKDNDYQKLGLDIKEHEIVYYTVYCEDFFIECKVYKIENCYSDRVENLRKQLENNHLWSKDKFYEYVMISFEDVIGKEKIDRENLYYYKKNDVYAIFDLKNVNLYYFRNSLLGKSVDYNDLLETNIKNYKYKEVYSIRSGLQGDGTDYYVYRFEKNKGKELKNIIESKPYWSKEKIDNEGINCFKYNNEVSLIQNGYYYYKKICRTSSINEKYNYTEEATGFESAIYDLDNNILYYYWTSI